MVEQHIDIATADGAMNTFVVHPEEGGPHPVVLFYMDAPGKREELHEMARRIAAVGYYVVLPNLYYRESRDFQLTVRDEAGMKRMFELMGTLTNEMVVRDTGALLAYVDAQPAAKASSVGAVGYCMSGPFVIAAAARYPDRIKCIASIHGAQLVTDRDDSPHLMLGKVRCETYVACAETDRWAPRPLIETFEAAMKKAGVNYRLEWYPGAEHGFVFPKRAGIYHLPSAERHWERLFAMFARNLAT